MYCTVSAVLNQYDTLKEPRCAGSIWIRDGPKTTPRCTCLYLWIGIGACTVTSEARCVRVE